MGSYRYTAYAPTGDLVRGSIDARSHAEALELIHHRGMLALEALEFSSISPPLGPRLRQLSLAGRVHLLLELATLLKAEVVLDQALRILGEGRRTRAAGAVVRNCAEHVAGGGRLSEALDTKVSGFRRDELAMIAAGEQNGSLAQVLDQLARLLERRLELTRRLTSALIYPSLLLLMALAAIGVIIAVLIPNIEPLFEGNEARLPAVVRILLQTQSYLADYGLTLAAGILAFSAGAAAAIKRPGVRAILDRALLRVPLAGGLVRKALVSRLCLTVAMLLESGVPLQQSLSAASGVVANAEAKGLLHSATEQVTSGGRLSHAFSGALFDEASLRLVALGEDTNRLAHMLHHVARTSESELVRQIERGMTLLTPVLTLILGISVGAIIMSVMQAILGISDMAAG
ncbi:MAG: type II secretion system F family protein [Hyphomicrobiales bacterium]